MKKEIRDLFNAFVSDAESYGSENLILARSAEGYVGDPKKFRDSVLYARLLPVYVNSLLVDYINEATKPPHRQLTPKEADWMQHEADKLYKKELAFVSQLSETKSAAQLDAEITEALRKRKP